MVESLAVLGTGACLNGALLGGVAIAWAALRQASIAARRHEAQTEADRQRRITESFGKAVEQLGSEKVETRLGGIYTLERISRESTAEYWTVMETLTAFVRERARWKKSDAVELETMARFFYEGPASVLSNDKPSTDIAAVLKVILRRGDKNHGREKTENWRFNLRRTDLTRTFLKGVYLENADLAEAHLEEADLRKAHLQETCLREAHLEQANLRKAHLKKAYLRGAHLEGAFLIKACLEQATLVGANLEGAYLNGANLGGASLDGANLRGADLSDTTGLTQDQLAVAIGDAKTVIPRGVARLADGNLRNLARANPLTALRVAG